jgi:hypothetical protein
VDDILHINIFLKRYPDVLTPGQLRWFIFHRDTNGIESSGAVFMKGRRWYVCLPKLREWMLAGDDRQKNAA